MAVNDMAVAMALLEALRVSFPKQDLIVLLIKWEAVVNAGVDKYSMLVDIHRWKFGDPVKMGRRNGTYVQRGRALAI